MSLVPGTSGRGNCSRGERRFAGSVGVRWTARVAAPTTCFRGLCRPRVEDRSRGRRETPRETASAWIRRIVGAARLRCGRRSSGPAAAACSACEPSVWRRRCASPQRRVLAGRDGSATRLLEIDLGDALVAARAAPAGSRHPEGLRRAGGRAGGHRARRPSAAGRQRASTGRAGVCGHRARRSDRSATRQRRGPRTMLLALGRCRRRSRDRDAHRQDHPAANARLRRAPPQRCG
jgi:hypothetical protein